MELSSEQGGLLDESLRLFTRASSILPETPLQLVEKSQSAVIEALWHHWVLSPHHVDKWVSGTSWPEDVKATERVSYKRDHIRAWRGRIAVRAALGKGEFLPASDVPSISKPRRLASLERDLQQLRALVRTQNVFGKLKLSFGDAIVDSVVSGSSIPGTPDQLWQAVQVEMEHPIATAREQPLFKLYLEVREAAGKVLEDDLPFGAKDGTMPPKFSEMFQWVEQLENSVARQLRSSRQGSLPSGASFLPWGLAMAAVVRAYLVDLLAGMTLGLIPIPLLYWAPRSLTRTTMAPGGQATKELYNSYTAVALWEAWTGKPVEHVDRKERTAAGDTWAGDGYLRRAGEDLPNLKNIAAKCAGDFSAFWAPNAPSFHVDIRKKLGSWSDRLKGIPQSLDAAETAAAKAAPPKTSAKSVPHTGAKSAPNTGATQPAHGQTAESVAIAEAHSVAQGLPLSTQGYRPWALLEIPRLELPEGMMGTEPDESFKESFKTTWHRGAHLHVQVALFVAQRLTERLGEYTNLKPAIRKWDNGPWKAPEHKKSQVLYIGDGSPRWGGNHQPHKEHRDGLTFDISHPFDFVPWEKRRARVSRSVELLCAYPKASARLIHLPNQYYEPDYITHIFDGGKVSAKNLMRAQLSSNEIQGLIEIVAAMLWGTPIHEPDASSDDALRHNLIGHIALMLAGVRKWVYAGVIQHVYALGIVAQVLTKVEVAKSMLQDFLGEFYCAPNDHHNHWHVVFPTRESWLTRRSEEGQDQPPAMEQVVRFWKRLGVDFDPMIKLLQERDTVSNLEVDADRNQLLRMLQDHGPEVPDGEPKGDELLRRLGAQIRQRAYPTPPPSPALKVAKYREIPMKEFEDVDPEYDENADD